jgi:hypothetical protein
MTVKIQSGFPITFLQKAASILGDTYGGLSGPKIINIFSAYAEKWDVSVPFPEYPYGARRKDEVFRENLKSFKPSQQFLIVSELCGLRAHGQNAGARERLKLELYSKYGELRPETDTKELELPFIEEARHWLEKYPESLNLFNQAKLKYDSGSFERNLLDDLRLALELLLKKVLCNQKTLENQSKYLGPYLKGRGASSQVNKMFEKLIDCYTNYQNDFVKHNDKVKEEEIEFVFEITASLMKHIVRISS